MRRSCLHLYHPTIYAFAIKPNNYWHNNGLILMFNIIILVKELLQKSLFCPRALHFASNSSISMLNKAIRYERTIIIVKLNLSVGKQLGIARALVFRGADEQRASRPRLDAPSRVATLVLTVDVTRRRRQVFCRREILFFAAPLVSYLHRLEYCSYVLWTLGLIMPNGGCLIYCCKCELEMTLRSVKISRSLDILHLIICWDYL